MAATRVIYAGYGVWNETYDCTGEAGGAVQDAFGRRQPTVKFIASNEEWGGDPSPGNRKYFFVAWDDNGTKGSGVVGEGDDRGVVVPTGAQS
jgi:hypothetical protein